MKCTPENTAFTTIAAYPQGIFEQKIHYLQSSMKRAGVNPLIFGVGEIYCNHFYMKIFKMLKWIKRLPDKYQFVNYSDGADSIFCGSAEAICEKFNSLNCNILCSGEEGPPHPLGLWESSFKGDCAKYPCAGGWMARIDEIVDLFERLIVIQNKIITGHRFKRLFHEKFFYDEWEVSEAGIKFLHDDQFWWHVSVLNYFSKIETDSKSEIFGNLGQTNNFRFENGRTIMGMCNSSPEIIHLSCKKCNVGEYTEKLGFSKGYNIIC